VHIRKRASSNVVTISGKPVARISAFLFHTGGDREPRPLASAPCRAGKGIVPWGMGFVFEDHNDDCSPLAEMNTIVAKSSRNSTRIHRFIGGADLNSSPTLSPERYIIDLDDLDEGGARAWPDLLRVVEARVRPQRAALPNTRANARLRDNWWKFSQGREVREVTTKLERVLVCSQTSKRRAFAFIPGKWVFDQKLIGFADDRDGFFAVMQSRPHELWSDFFGSTMKDDPVYTPPSCFEAFAFPKDWDANTSLEVIGKTYYGFRAAFMAGNNEGLTETYNRFHDPEESDADILKLRDLHAAMDRAVLDAYGWTDILPTCEFLLDYEEEDDDSEFAAGRRKKKPWRYRWPDDVRDEVLARLLELNAIRAKEETSAPPSGRPPAPKGSSAKLRGGAKRAKNAPSRSGNLFSGEDE
jgi:restriction-modification enzyme MmeI-like protein